MEVIEFDAPQLILSASGDTTTGSTGDSEAGDETEDLATRRRGSWGNLWE